MSEIVTRIFGTYAIRSKSVHKRLFLTILLALVSSAASAAVVDALPTEFSADKYYIFYIHGRIIESEGPDARSPRFGDYEYREIVSALDRPNHVVIAELRSGDTNVFTYSHKLAADIRYMIAEGVPAERISVAGFSKGGYITLLTAKMLQIPSVKFVVMAGCAKSIVEGQDRNADGLDGTILAMVDYKDDLGFPCQALFDRNVRIATHAEIVFQDGSGHGFFYRASPQWIEPLLRWIR